MDNLDKLIEEIESKIQSRDLSDSYLRENNCSTRNDIGIGEYVYGITMVPADWVLPYLKELQQIKMEM